MREEARQLSSGRVRLEDARKFGAWLMGKPLPTRTREREKRVELPELVPIFITCLTARPDRGEIVFRQDVHARDAVQFAANEVKR